MWQRSYALSLKIYAVTKTFPDDERFGLVSQLRRAGVSVPTNIAEGSMRKGRADFAHFLNMAEGSCAEMASLLMTAKDLGYSETDRLATLLKETTEVARMLFKFRTKVEAG